MASFSAVVRATGGGRLGFGHLRRCWTLADAVVALGGAVRFVTTDAAAAVALAPSRYAVTLEPAPDALAETRRLASTTGAGVIVVDDPHLEGDDLGSLRALAPVACFDDTAERVLPVDLVVNGAAGAEALVYRGAGRAVTLLGPRFMVLRPEFAGVPARPTRDRIGRVLVMLGGGEAGDLAATLVGAILHALAEVSIDVVAGPFTTLPSFAHPRVTVHRVPSDVRALMTAADVAVTAGGQTCYELAACGTPAVGLQVADNQAPNLEGLARAGVLWNLGRSGDARLEDRVVAALRALDTDVAARQAMAASGRRLVDGRGAVRVADELAALAGSRVA